MTFPARQSLPPWVADWWRPIETAPKDGSIFLAQMKGNPDLGPLIICWAKLDDTWVTAWDATSLKQAWGDEPTRWMPLPPDPR